MSTDQKKLYFSAGPAKIPRDVMLKIHSEFLDYQGCGVSVAEMSHRSKEFDKIITEAETDLRKLLNVPDNYTILFMHGGAKLQFSAIPMNLCQNDQQTVEYLINGSWCKMAATEAEKYTTVIKRNRDFNSAYKRDDLVSVHGARYRYYCDNETIEGIEFDYVPDAGDDCLLISDMTSNFLSRPVDISKFGVVFASAQKNCGIAGLAIVIVRKDLIGNESKITPKLMNYKVMHDNRSLYNTPPTFAIYVAGLCFKWMLEQGGLEVMDERSKEKANLLYAAIDNSDGFYVNNLDRSSRSRMNVVWLLEDSNLEKAFLEDAKAANIFDIKGHRSIGGFRASLYHGVTLDDVNSLIKFMSDFRIKHNP